MVTALTGFMGSGKSSVGRALSELLCVPFIDLDEYIMQKEGKRITEIFDTQGEEGFRALESQALGELLADGLPDTDLVLSLGGGTILRKANAALIARKCKCVFLRTRAETLRRRLQDERTERPLLRGDNLEQMLSHRTPAYERAADIVIDTDGLTPEQIAKEIAKDKTPPAHNNRGWLRDTSYIQHMSKIKHLLTAIAFAFAAAFTSFAQFSQPVSWQFESESKGENVYEIRAVGTFNAPGWHIYDLADYGDEGPNATVFTIEGEGVTPTDDPHLLTEVKKEYDDIFGMEIGICEGRVVIAQTVQLEGGHSAEATVTVEWQCCNDQNCLPPSDESKTLSLEGSEGAAVAAAEDPQNDSSSSSDGLLGLILEAILWGFAMLLTPCVFPMVPMTVSFFMKGSESKAQGRFKATMYGVFIVLLYTVPICVIIGLTWILGGDSVTADIFNWLATHWLPNILFFTIFMIFAASFFGAFEITLPSKWVNSSDQKSEKKGLGGVFFLALTLVLVSFSCTGPIVGTVLIKSTQGEFWTPMVTMLAFSVAFALPFALLAFFPSLIKGLKGKSGGWLNSVKVVLGFIEIALGFKFLSTADQTYHWGLLDREIYLAIWIVVFSLLGLYLLGKIRFANDSPVEHLSVPRLALSIVVFTFVVYMIPGMWGAPLKGLSGYLPPITTQDFVLDPAQNGTSTLTISPSAGSSDDSASVPSRKYSDFLEMPYGIEAFYDYEEARAYAESVGKPLFIDFTGHGCVNCREMETRVWSDPRALKMLREDYVVCSLFADDKKIVDEADWVTTEDGKVLKSLGKINSYFALKRFNVNAQPYYAILDPATGEHKMPSRGYNLDIQAFVDFLQGGLK